MSFKNVEVKKKANVYFDGKVTSRTVTLANGEMKTLGVMLPGTYHFNTQSPEVMDVTQGSCKVKLAGEPAWREYKAGKRTLCGVPLPEGLNENDKLPTPIITPTTKAHVGHDEDISREEILKRGIVSESDYITLEQNTFKPFQKGTELAAERGLILVDTKYEFGKHNGTIYLIDEVHTPDSSRYFYTEGYEARQKAGEAQKQLSKEFVRQWLIENGFQGKDGQKVPEMTEAIVSSISARYKELYQQVRGESLPSVDYGNLSQRIEQSILNSINSVNLETQKI